MSNKKIKAVFFDIDGTLLSFKTHQVPSKTEKAIELLKSKGIKVIISTGRSINSIDHIKYLDFDGYITFNGGYCVDNNQEILFRKTMDEQDIRAVIEAGHQQQLSYSFMSEKEISIYNVTPEVAGMYTSLNLPVPDLIDFNKIDTAGVLQTNIFIQPEHEAEFMRRVMPNSVATRWTPLFTDVNPKGQSKKVGIDVFCRYYGFDRSTTMAFGDGGNDIEMLKHVEIGVAMGNANPEVKSIANYITDDVDADGIWNALHQYEVL